MSSHPRIFATVSKGRSIRLCPRPFSRGAVDILLRELPESPEKRPGPWPLSCFELINDLDGCRRLIDAGNVLRRSYQTSAALGFFLKALDDLELLESGDRADSLFY